ncbi:MFS transporter [Spongisporangium articulatum]|uniref:MFS transporter n=1 Tax=Spongisporangium articulatum TaxID=3362603 RepID=A0ABW8AR15_9ACTN
MSTDTLTRAAAPARPRPLVTHGAGFWVVGWAFLVAMAFSTVPTPLYAIYQARDGFPTYVVTIVFASYAVGVSASLYLAGHLSDWFGRRPVVLIALLTEVLSAAVFLLWQSVPALVVARFVGGLGIGVLTATATAHLAELNATARPGRGRRAVTVATGVNLGGLAVGPLIGGVLAQYVTRPLETPYAIFLVLLVVSALAVAVVPETVERPAERPAYRPQQVRLPGETRSTFAAAAVGAAAAFSVMGLFMSLAPTVLAGTLHVTSRLAAGAVAFSVLAAATVAQLALGGLTPRRQLSIGLVVMPAGLVLIAASVAAAVTWLFVAGAVVAGVGLGLVFKAAAATAAGLAAPQARGETMAAFFLIAYVGLAVPVLLIGAALSQFETRPVVLVFTAVVGVAVVGAGLKVLRALR